MKVPSKNVVMGILFSFALLPILSCAIAVPGEYGSIAIGISIPKSIGNASLPSALREAFAPSASSRFIHPGTRRIEVVVALNGGREQIRADASVAEGEESVSITVGKVPYGTHELTVSLYGSEGDLLSRGTTAVSVESRAAASANVTAVPVTERTFRPGPFGGDYGVVIPTADYGTLCVYRVSMPNAGSYGLRLTDSLSRIPFGYGILSLYGSDGLPIPFNSFADYTAYAEIPAGECYVVVDAPHESTGEVRLSLDADLRVAMSAHTVSIRPGLLVQDRMRPLTINIPSGFSGEYSVDFGDAAGRTCSFSSPSSKEILATPGEVGLASCDGQETNAQISFTDALLGYYRENHPFSFAGAPRTFIYDSGVKPNDSMASAPELFVDIVDKARSYGETRPVIVALQDGKTYDGGLSIAFQRGVCILGGFGAQGVRPAKHGESQIEFESTSAISFNENAIDSVLDSIDIVLDGANIVTGESGIQSYAKTTLKNCTITYVQDYVLGGARDSYDYSLLTAGFGDMTIDGCSLLGPRISINGTINYTVNAINITTGSGDIRISNSLISPCTVLAKTTDSQVNIYGINAPSFDSGSITIAGSTISSGLIAARTFTDPLIMQPLCVDGTGALILANDLLVGGNPTDAGSAFVYYAGNPDDNLHLDHCILGYPGTIAGETILIRYSLSGVTFGNWARTKYGANPVLSQRELSLASTDATRAGFLRPQASSPDELRTGGADLTVGATRSALHVAGIEPEYLIRDGLGAARTGDGTAGYTIGAFELD